MNNQIKLIKQGNIKPKLHIILRIHPLVVNKITSKGKGKEVTKRKGEKAESRIMLLQHKYPPPTFSFLFFLSCYYAYFRLG